MIESLALSDQVYKHLLGEILGGELTSGAALREPELATRLGVSRTPIREALGRLAHDGLVEIKPNRSALVRRLGRAELAHIYQVREALEGMAAELACGKLTRDDFARLKELSAATRDESSDSYQVSCHRFDVELHRVVAVCSGNPVLAGEIRKFHHLVQLVRDCVGNQEGALRVACREHLAIVAALKSGDRVASRKAMIDHIRTSCAVALRYVAVETTVPVSTPGVLGPAAAVLTADGWGSDR